MTRRRQNLSRLLGAFAERTAPRAARRVRHMKGNARIPMVLIALFSSAVLLALIRILEGLGVSR